MGFNEIWNLKFEISNLAAIGSKLGSDVPFFLHGPSSLCAGRGERVTPIPRPAAGFAVLFFPKLSMSTPAVYQRFDELKLTSDAALDPQLDWPSCSKLAATDLLEVLVNDLEAPAFSLCPELGELRNRIEQTIARRVRMSGSGSTLFTLADHLADARRIAAQFRDPSIRAGVFELAPAPPAE